MLSLFLFSPPKIPYPLPPALLPKPPTPIPGPGIPLYWGIDPSHDLGPLHSLMANYAILSYICS